MARSKSSTKTAAMPATPAKKTAKPSKTKIKPIKTSINVDKKSAESVTPGAVEKKTIHKEKQEKDAAPPAPAPVTVSPYQLDKEQTLKAARALLKHISLTGDRTESTKPNLLADEEDPSDNAVPLWLILSSKKYISDQKKLKPSQVRLPHSLLNRETATVCLIVKDPQRHYKDLVAAASITNTVTKVVGVSKLRKKFKAFETRRQLTDSHDIFLADDRIVTRLPTILGATFYRKSSKIPIPVSLARSDSTANLKNQISKALSSTYLHLSPAASTSIKVALSSFNPEQVVENVEKVVKDVVEKKIPGGWKNLKSLHIKSPNSASLPIYMAGEVYGDEDVLKPEEEHERLMLQAKQAAERKERKGDKKRKRKAQIELKPVDGETTEKTKADADKPKEKRAKVASD